MHRNRVALPLVMLTLSFGLLFGGATALAASPRAASATSCKANAYASSCKNCRTEPASGTFKIAVPNSKASLVGKGSAASKGAHICLTPASLPKPSLGGTAFRVSAQGKFAPLKVSAGTLYWFSQATNKVTKVKVVDRAGMYQLVP